MRYQVPPEAAGLSLGKYLYDRVKLSRTLVRRAKQQQGVLVDGRLARMDYLLRGGESVELVLEEEGRVAPEAMDLAIAYEDEELLVVEKPPGMVVHPVKDYVTGTLAAGVVHHLVERGEPPVARPIQRIDRDTSGLVLFAKNPAVAGSLSREMERHKLDRRYIAFVQGVILADSGTVDVPTRRVWGHPVAREAAVGPRTPEQEALLAEAAAAGQVLREEWKGAGQQAVTHYEVLRRWSGATMLALRLETGRTHQIRVHMAYLGHPLLGDEMYGGPVGCGPLGRQALHAASLVFAHPVSGALISLESPVPADLRLLMAWLDERG